MGIGARRRRRESFAESLEHVATAVLIEVDVHRAHAVEDLVGYLLLLIAIGICSHREGDRLAVLDGHLRELEAPPAADMRRAVDRHRDDRHAGLQRDLADAALRLPEIAGA